MALGLSTLPEVAVAAYGSGQKAIYQVRAVIPCMVHAWTGRMKHVEEVAVLEQLPERLSSKIATDPSGCWRWTASLRDGYGQVRVGSRVRGAHVVVYELLVGSVPDGMELDHACRNRWCVNPEHLSPMTHRENVLRGEAPSAVNARKTHCPRGHQLGGDNGRPSAPRVCRICALTIHAPKARVAARVARRRKASR